MARRLEPLIRPLFSLLLRTSAVSPGFPRVGLWDKPPRGGLLIALLAGLSSATQPSTLLPQLSGDCQTTSHTNFSPPISAFVLSRPFSFLIHRRIQPEKRSFPTLWAWTSLRSSHTGPDQHPRSVQCLGRVWNGSIPFPMKGRLGYQRVHILVQSSSLDAYNPLTTVLQPSVESATEARFKCIESSEDDAQSRNGSGRQI